MDSDNDSYHGKNEFYYPDEISYFLNVKRTRTPGLKMAQCSENSTQKRLTKYSTEENNKHVICQPRSVRIGKNCVPGLEYGLRPVPSGPSSCTQALWHSFSQYGPHGRQLTYIYGLLKFKAVTWMLSQYYYVHVTSVLKQICSILLQLIKQSGKIIADMESQ